MDKITLLDCLVLFTVLLFLFLLWIDPRQLYAFVQGMSQGSGLVHFVPKLQFGVQFELVPLQF